ncbi:MAG: XRE family transcriptional regulator, partial [Coriobacteriia bacterium]|nr:XRE family transcriptional regulator [Coriobacteriia bacterium]
MSERVHSVNGAMLAWAREWAGLSVVDVASSMGKGVEDIEAWERGTAWPTYNQLEQLAESVFHRPVALFFFPEPPLEVSAQEEFRTLPDFEVADLSEDTRYAVRIGLAYQESLRELTGGTNPGERLITKDLRISASQDVGVVAAQLREYLGVTLAEQMAWSNSESAMAQWRNAVEVAGVYVFKRSFKQREVSGFCLTDGTFPIIFINNSTSFNRQIFTLLHELAHLLFGVSSITTEKTGFIDQMSDEGRSLEIACNRLASEFLMPVGSFPWSDFRPEDV